MGTCGMNLREMPEELVRRVKAHAAMSGVTLKAYVVEALERAIRENGDDEVVVVKDGEGESI